MGIKGGARVGAGRKPKGLRTQNGDLRLQILAAAPALIDAAINLGKGGDPAMLRWLIDHLLGKASSPDERALLAERTALVRAQRELVEAQLRALKSGDAKEIRLNWGYSNDG